MLCPWCCAKENQTLNLEFRHRHQRQQARQLMELKCAKMLLKWKFLKHLMYACVSRNLSMSDWRHFVTVAIFVHSVSDYCAKTSIGRTNKSIFHRFATLFRAFSLDGEAVNCFYRKLSWKMFLDDHLNFKATFYPLDHLQWNKIKNQIHLENLWFL